MEIPSKIWDLLASWSWKSVELASYWSLQVHSKFRWFRHDELGHWVSFHSMKNCHLPNFQHRLLYFILLLIFSIFLGYTNNSNSPTLVSRIIVQIGIKVQVGKISKGWNFGKFITMNYGFSFKISKFNKSACWNKGVQVRKFLKFNKVCCTIIRGYKV